MGVAKNVIRGNGMFRLKIIEGKFTRLRNDESRRKELWGVPEQTERLSVCNVTS